ncbi:hypothetical protein Snoj_35040 [Streptomyces nojiriensis]|uniref:Uncharacterized protein n=1 Tax=Streptomyces nojiriensis TaxID=66374 RepID=A0ABQ3SN85_9ACTN|nr:hypothetical protein [Streptomyces nojiriensis]GGS31651.1 hypothetical protein GCM10010205_72380 [Streptomyces nojiriensis]GHI69586.1 hypothetical protein Snoj_35040 [Streptomyces nojiriensis]
MSAVSGPPAEGEPCALDQTIRQGVSSAFQQDIDALAPHAVRRTRAHRVIRIIRICERQGVPVLADHPSNAGWHD